MYSVDEVARPAQGARLDIESREGKARMSLSMEDLQYVDDPSAAIDARRAEIVDEVESGDMTDEEAEDENEELDGLQGRIDEAGSVESKDD